MKVKLAKNVSNSCWVIGKHFSIATFELQVTRVKSCGLFYDKISPKLQSEIQHEQYPHEAVKGFIYLHHWQLRFAQFCELEIHVNMKTVGGKFFRFKWAHQNFVKVTRL